VGTGRLGGAHPLAGQPLHHPPVLRRGGR
jgi:hypothetical protein